MASLTVSVSVIYKPDYMRHIDLERELLELVV